MVHIVLVDIRPTASSERSAYGLRFTCELWWWPRVLVVPHLWQARCACDQSGILHVGERGTRVC
jgi:hypothetical protein